MTMSIREIATSFGKAGSGREREHIAKDLDAGLRKMWDELAARVRFASAADAMFETLTEGDADYDPPEWLLAVFRRHYRPEARFEPVVPRPSRREPRYSERDFARHLHREWRGEGRV